MAKDKFSDYDSTAANNEDIGGISILGTAPPSNFDNALRELMSHLADNFASDTIASATTTDLGSKAAQYLSVTGTTTITGLGTVKAGTIKFLKFDGALTLTHNGTSLIIPGAANITTAAGDTAVMVSEGSGNWRCVNYQRAASRPTQAWEEIERKTFSGASSADFLNLGAFRALRFNGVIIPDTDARTILLRTSVDNGANWTAGTAYSYNYAGGSDTSFVGSRVTGANAFIVSGFAVGNGSDRGVTLDDLKLWQFNQATKCRIVGNVLAVSNSDVEFPLDVAGRIDTAARNAVSFLGGSSSNISGYIVLEGIRS